MNFDWEMDLSGVHAGMRMACLSQLRVPLLIVSCDAETLDRKRIVGQLLEQLLWKLSAEAGSTFGLCGRCVELAKLPYVLQAGIDVEPTDSVIYVDGEGFEKALEYGGDYALLMILNWRSLKRTWVHLRPPFDPALLQTCRLEFPTEIGLPDGTLWFTRLKEKNPNAASSYEAAHAYWIPGDPWQTLQILVAVGPDFEEICRQVAEYTAITDDGVTPQASS